MNKVGYSVWPGVRGGFCLKLLEGTGDAEAVVGVLKFGRDAGAGGTARHFCVMAPGTAARRAARSGRRTLRIAVARGGVIVRVEPVGAPFVDVCGDVTQAEGIAFSAADGFRAGFPARRVIREG